MGGAPVVYLVDVVGVVVHEFLLEADDLCRQPISLIKILLQVHFAILDF